MSLITIISFHFVRDPEPSGVLANLNIRNTFEFEKQLEFIGSNYSVISTEQVLGALYKQLALPPNPCWLTFDDGYLEHFTYVCPMLEKRGWHGAFFPAVDAIENRAILDVNMAHLILGNALSPDTILDAIKQFIFQAANAELTESFSDLCSPSRYTAESQVRRWSEPPQTLVIKRVLQRARPVNLRKAMLNRLFFCFVSEDSQTIAEDLYMSKEQVIELHRRGMYVGGHGGSHDWLSTLSASEKATDAKKTKDFVASIGTDVQGWIYCYPYGDWDSPSISFLKQAGCVMGLTNIPGRASLSEGSAFMIKRFDTNDFPFA